MDGLQNSKDLLDPKNKRKSAGLVIWLAFSVVCMIAIYMIFDIAMASL
ncbi:MAG: hypothetical protein ISR51_05695 [Rhodospirillales bacterium]|nr:hypothetical protein [Alphaproteobacteria bacterium]MBL6948150.1 hypothetical protein [Rhodospirillales bacterium]